MSNRRKLLAGSCILLLAVLLLAYGHATRPRPVVARPASAELIYIRVDFPEDRRAENVDWYPATPEEKETAQAILAYLGQCQEKPIPRKSETRFGISGPFLTIMVKCSPHDIRGIVLGPSAPVDDNIRSDFTYDAETGGRRAALIHPDALRSYVLNALDLPADLL